VADSAALLQAQVRRLPKALREWPAYGEARERSEAFAALVPLLRALAQPCVRPRHWRRLMELCGAEWSTDESKLRLQHLLDAGLAAKAEEVEAVASSAAKEAGVEAKLSAIEAEWGSAALTFADYKTRGPVVLKPADTAELVEKLEEAQVALSALAANRAALPFRERVGAWSGRLAAVSDVLEQWLAVQSMWTYMEAVFSGERGADTGRERGSFWIGTARRWSAVVRARSLTRPLALGSPPPKTKQPTTTQQAATSSSSSRPKPSASPPSIAPS
jgi:dynein heavy chain